MLLATSQRGTGRAQAKSKLLTRLWRQRRRLITYRSSTCAARVISCCWRSSSSSAIANTSRKRALLVFLSNVPFQNTVHLVDVDRDLRLNILRIVFLIRNDVSRLFHAVHLFCAPGVHAQALDLADVRAQLPVQSGAAHAQEDTKIPARPSWVLCAAVGAAIVARDAADEVLERLLVASLLSLGYGRGHDSCVPVRLSKGRGCARIRTRASQRWFVAGG